MPTPTHKLYHPETGKAIIVDYRTEAPFIAKGYTRSPAPKPAAAAPKPAAAPVPAPAAQVDVSDPAAAIAGAKGKAELLAVAKALGHRVPDDVTKAADIRAFLVAAITPAPDGDDESSGDESGSALDDLI